MIRPFLMKNLSRVLEIWLASMPSSHPFLGANYFIEHYQEFQEDHLLSSQTTVYEIGGKIIGFISIKQDMSISALCVDPQYQKKGYGEQLIQSLKNRFSKLHVQVYLDNLSAVAFFQRNGFFLYDRIQDEKTNKKLGIFVYDQSLHQKSLN